MFPDLLEIRLDFIEAFHSIKIISSALHADFLAAYNYFPLLFLYWRFDLALFIILLPFLIYLNFRASRFFIRWLDRRKIVKNNLQAEREKLLKQKKELKKLVSQPIGQLNSYEMQGLKDKFTVALLNKSFRDIRADLSTKLKEIDLELPLVRRHEKIENLKIKEELAEEKIVEIEKAIKDKELQLRNFEDTSLRKLNASDTPVYLEEDLTEKEKSLLLKYDYQRAYEYCVHDQDSIHVLVKPAMRHSVTHIFLVWSVMKLLRSMKEISDVQDWDTRETDIAFKHQKNCFALEIETGTLLKKKVQLRRKIEYLQSKYKDRWMIIVSKKSLASKYRKFGPVATRSEVPKKLEKMLKSARVS